MSFMRSIQRLFLGVVAILLFGVAPLCAEYTIVLKNGRRITVESYREEGNMIKFPGFGGEIGIAKDQIRSIEKAGQKESRGMVVEKERTSPLPSGPSAVGEAVPAKEEKPAAPQEKAVGPEEKLAEERAKEEKEYQRKLKELTQQIKTLKDRYARATRGTTGPEPSVPTSEEELKARQDDLVSRLRDAQRARPGSAPSVRPPLPGYTEKQKELSDIRNRLYQLEKERDKLIEEMKQKNFDTGSLFLE